MQNGSVGRSEHGVIIAVAATITMMAAAISSATDLIPREGQQQLVRVEDWHFVHSTECASGSAARCLSTIGVGDLLSLHRRL